jgi:hypothetical protein
VPKVLIWIGMIWLITWSSMVLGGALQWTNPLSGAISGASDGLIIAPFLLIFTIPAGLIGWGIGSWRPLRNWRLALSLIFAAAMPLWTVAKIAVERMHPDRPFTRLTKVAFPQGATISECHLQGGGLADLNYTYEFTCSQAETERLIRELKLSKSDTGESFWGPSGAGSTVGGSGGWKIEEVWSFDRDFDSDPPDTGGAHYIELHTDTTRTKVRLICGTI